MKHFGALYRWENHYTNIFSLRSWHFSHPIGVCQELCGEKLELLTSQFSEAVCLVPTSARWVWGEPSAVINIGQGDWDFLLFLNWNALPRRGTLLLSTRRRSTLWCNVVNLLSTPPILPFHSSLPPYPCASSRSRTRRTLQPHFQRHPRPDRESEGRGRLAMPLSEGKTSKKELIQFWDWSNKKEIPVLNLVLVDTNVSLSTRLMHA